MRIVDLAAVIAVAACGGQVGGTGDTQVAQHPEGGLDGGADVRHGSKDAHAGDAVTDRPVDTRLLDAASDHLTDALNADVSAIEANAPDGMKCTTSCVTDTDCESTCPPVSGLLNCCDPGTGVCFTSVEVTCPPQAPLSCGAMGFTGFPCSWEPDSNSVCAMECPAAPSGFSNCCYSQSGVCFFSPTALCPPP
jgi:hypothetical protein